MPWVTYGRIYEGGSCIMSLPMTIPTGSLGRIALQSTTMKGVSMIRTSPPSIQLKIELDSPVRVPCSEEAFYDSPCFRASVSPEAYDTACDLVRTLATRGTDFRCLMNSGINPFFIIYSFADCGVHLPDCFSRELLWRHLDG